MKKYSFKILTFLIGSAYLFSTSAQSPGIKATVVDAKTNLPIDGATIKGQGKTLATSNVRGQFSIPVSFTGKEIDISAVGYQTFTVSSMLENMTIKLTPTTEQLGEVVVVGYGTSRKKDVTGSIVTVGTKDFNPGSYASPEQLIQGKVAGVQISTNSGAPGAGSTIRIRGGASLSASNDPLIVLDGVLLSNNSIAGQANPLTLINTDDIESFTILKDASATAIYGSRASNGVILITTKKGSKSGLKFNLNTQAGVQTIANKVNVLSPQQFRSAINATGNQAYIGLLGNANTDWQNEIYQTAVQSQLNFSVSGALFKKALPFRLSVGQYYQDGILKTDNLNRQTVTVNLSPSLLKNHLKIDFNSLTSLSASRFADQGAIGAAASFDPTKPVYSGNSRYLGYYEWINQNSGLINGLAPRNPVGLLQSRQNNSNVLRNISTLKVDYAIHGFEALHFNVNLGRDYSYGSGTNVVSDSAGQSQNGVFVVDGVRYGGQNNQYASETENSYINANIQYTKNFNNKVNLDLLAGYEFQDYKTTNYNYASYSYSGVERPGTQPAFPLNIPQYQLESFFGRANVSILNRYVFTATFRRDGSTKFSEPNRYANFPSFAFAWNIINEKFLANNKDVSNLKLRLSYGVTGQQDGIGYYDYLSFYNLSSLTASYQLGNTFYQGFRPSGYYYNRTWEQASTYNLALDLGFIDNRITATFEVYKRYVDKLLNEIPQPALTNFANRIVANVGTMEVSGAEISLGFVPIKTKNWNWDFNLNGSYVRNEITKLTISSDPNYLGLRYGGISGGVGSNILINSEGYRRGAFFVLKQEYDVNGNPIDNLFGDQNRDGIINERDYVRYQSIDPLFVFGFTTNLNYRRWTLSMTGHAFVGNYLYNNVNSANANLSNLTGYNMGYLNNVPANFLNSNFAGQGSNFFFSDYFVENASFFRLDNINLNVNVLNKQKVRLSINATVQNVFVITKYSGLDPEINSGIDNNFYPRPRTFLIGVNVNF